MPTTRQRHLITETEPVADALDAAALRWPDESRARLLVRLVEVGHRTLIEQGAERSAAIRETSGALHGVYPVGYLDDLRQDWPP